MEWGLIPENIRITGCWAFCGPGDWFQKVAQPIYPLLRSRCPFLGWPSFECVWGQQAGSWVLWGKTLAPHSSSFHSCPDTAGVISQSQFRGRNWGSETWTHLFKDTEVGPGQMEREVKWKLWLQVHAGALHTSPSSNQPCASMFLFIKWEQKLYFP